MTEITPDVPLGQALLAAGAVAIAFRLAVGLLPRTATWARTGAIAVAAILGVRYVLWRWTYTLPPLDTTFEALWPWLFAVTESVVLAHGFVSLFTLTRHADRTPRRAWPRATTCPPSTSSSRPTTRAWIS